MRVRGRSDDFRLTGGTVVARLIDELADWASHYIGWLLTHYGLRYNRRTLRRELKILLKKLVDKQL